MGTFNDIVRRSSSALPSLRTYSTRASSSLQPTIKEILSPDHATSTDVPLTVNGWVRSIRRQKNVAFAEINDGSTLKGIQAVLPAERSSGFSTGCSVSLRGKLVDSPGQGQLKELAVDEATVLGASNPDLYPIQKKSHGAAFLRKNAHLRPRSNTTAVMLRLRSAMAAAVRNYFQNEHFLEIQTPIITSSDCEGAGEVFLVESASATRSLSTISESPDVPAPQTSIATQPAQNSTSTRSKHFFGRPAYLTVSSQLHLEALASSLGRVYTLGPTFRAEPSDTNRHLAEFWMLEAELAFVDDTEGVMGVVEGAIRAAVSSLLDDSRFDPSDLAFLDKWVDRTATTRIKGVTENRAPWARMTYTEAIEHLQRHQEQTGEFAYSPEWGKDLQSEHEKWLADKLVGGPVFVTNYPRQLKPFYMRPDDHHLSPPKPSSSRRETVSCFDLLVPRMGELCGGSLREERLERLEEAMIRHGLNLEEYDWYLDLRRFGTVPHGGFGIGWERLISWVTGLDNLRECIAFPRAAEEARF